MATFVLVHGSCHGGWCWKKVTPFLCKVSHEVYTPTLTGLGERSHLVSRDIRLDTHILDIIQVLEYENLNEVILVGHSYGGLVIGGVAEKLPERIRRLVYLDAYIPQDNKSAFDIIPGLENVYKERALKEEAREWLVASYKPEEFGVTNPDDISWMNPRLSPMPWHTHDQPLRITNPKAKILPKSYVCCTEFGNAQFKAQKSPADWDYHELMKGHDVMIIAPKELVQLL
ncbi:MAG: alpha/beta hydrolase, partial [Candidatus Nitrosopolaris sp.]